jgi:Putative transmembrane protein (PGPGW)
MAIGEWLKRHDGTLLWVSIVSLGFVVISLALIPILIARLPSDYFAHERRRAFWLRRLSPSLRACVLAAKNLLGLIVVVCGVLMLVLPGQGLLTLLVGLSLLDVPGKYRLERWLLLRRVVFDNLNWIRRRLHKPPFAAPLPPRGYG